MKTSILKSIVIISVIILFLCVFMYLMFKNNVVITIEHFSFWSSILMALATILVTVLLIVNFSYTFKIIEVSNDVQDKMKKYDGITTKLDELEINLNKISDPQYINDVIFNKEQILNYLEGLKSKNNLERKQAALFFKNYEKDTYFLAILSAANKEKDEEIRLILNQTLVKLKK